MRFRADAWIFQKKYVAFAIIAFIADTVTTEVT